MRLRSDVVAISRGQAPRLERGPGAALDPDFYQVLGLDFGRILTSSFARAVSVPSAQHKTDSYHASSHSTNPCRELPAWRRPFIRGLISTVFLSCTSQRYATPRSSHTVFPLEPCDFRLLIGA